MKPGRLSLTKPFWERHPETHPEPLEFVEISPDDPGLAPVLAGRLDENGLVDRAITVRLASTS